jgi:catalase (peroxidase I)
MGFETYGFAGGREDEYTSNEATEWGPKEDWEETSPERYHDGEVGNLKDPLANTVRDRSSPDRTPNAGDRCHTGGRMSGVQSRTS